MVHEVHTECGQLKNEFSIVGVGTAVLPRPVVMHIPEVDDIPEGGREEKGEAVKERANEGRDEGRKRGREQVSGR